MINVLKKDVFYNQYGTRRSRVEFEGAYSEDDISKQLATDAPYGWHLAVACINEDKKLYRGELDEYWD